MLGLTGEEGGDLDKFNFSLDLDFALEAFCLESRHSILAVDELTLLSGFSIFRKREQFFSKLI